METEEIVYEQWPLSPPHWLGDAGNYIVTAATYYKEPFFKDAWRLTYLHRLLLKKAADYNWTLQAWAVFPNHYHFVGTPKDPANLPQMIRHIHSVSAREVNGIDGMPGRKVWFNYWETLIDNEKSWWARLKYVNENAVKHGIVKHAKSYPYCSAGWLEASASALFIRKLSTFGISRVSVDDDY